jgi:hypothetical protein
MASLKWPEREPSRFAAGGSGGAWKMAVSWFENGVRALARFNTQISKQVEAA